ncbi:MAG: chalcone isomerase family protein [Candidatus Sumerlaeia bacterium]|nr:chalcone isomerase family protein [Candidatus Sumerlaeia bacterium]
MRLLMLLCVLNLAALQPLRAEEPSSVCHDSECFPTTTSVGEARLRLQGIGLLRVWQFRVYTAALHVPENWDAKGDVLDAIPKRLELRYHREITRAQIVKASEDLLARTPGVDKTVLQERLDRIYDWYRDVKAGDSYVLEYHPDTGTTLLSNGEFVGTIPGDDFARAKFGLWLGSTSLSDSLREKLLTPYPRARARAPRR